MMTGDGEIPFLDLVTPHLDLEEELVSIFRAALRTAGFVGGPMVEEFERDFAQFCEAKHCVGVSSGTDALRFALIAAGIQPGDIVITAPHTFIATTEAISQALALPDFVDIEERTCTMDSAKLREYCETKCFFDADSRRLFHKKTGRPVTALIPVHLYGQMADMDAIVDIARRYNLLVIEDACQAHGAEYFSERENRWEKAGSVGHAAAFSFYPGKNLGACGEAGAVTTNDSGVARKVRMLRDHGQLQKYCHEMQGYNGRLDAIQAGILRVKLPHLAEWNAKRRALAARYHELLKDLTRSVIPPYESPRARAVYYLYVIRVQDREGLRTYLAEASIGAGIHYPIPLHLQNAYRMLGYREGDFPVTERVAREVLSLPIYPQLTPSQQDRTVQKIREFVSTQRGKAADSATL